MKWEMEVLSPASYLSSTNLFLQDIKTRWTPSENKMFENALALHDKDTPERWFLVAQMIPGKTVGDVIRHYRELEVDVSNIEAGLIPIPGYSTASPFTLEWVSSNGFDGFKQPYGLGSKRSSAARPLDHERKKGIPWTEEEHKLFLLGLKKYGKGDWRNISRNFVVTRTPTQVASHAQKYFIRQVSGGKDKRRASIHDITTVNLTDTGTASPDSKDPPSPDHSTTNILSQSPSSTSMPKAPNFAWNQPNSGGTMAFSATHGNENAFIAPAFGFNSYGPRNMQGQNLHRTGNTFNGYQSSNFQLQSMQRYPHG